MPDFERLNREVELCFAAKFIPDKVSVIEARFKGEDRARKEIACVAFGLMCFVHICCFFIGRYT